jgi:hypothetical protein
MAEALEKGAEDETPGTVIRVTEGWDCIQPLEEYGSLPIVIESRIDNDATQPETVSAVSLTSPDCAGDGKPEHDRLDPQHQKRRGHHRHDAGRDQAGRGSA